MNKNINLNKYIIKNIDLLSFACNITTGCNKRCKHCYLTKEQLSNYQYMEIKTFNNFINHVKKSINISKDFSNINKFEIQLLGGEIFYQQDKIYFKKIMLKLLNLYKYVKINSNLEFMLDITSNLLKEINEDFVKSFAESYKLFEAENCEGIYFNTSYEPDTNRFSKNDILLWYKNVDLFKKYNITVGLNFVLTSGSVDMIINHTKEFINLISKFKDGNIYINFFEPSEGMGKINEKELIPEYDKLIKALKIIKKLSNDHDISYTFEEENKFEENFELNETIYPNGDLIAIHNLIDSSIKLNVNNQIKEEEIKNFIQNNHNILIEDTYNRIKQQQNICYNCEFIKECLGGLNLKNNSYYNKKKITNENFHCNGFYKYRKVN